MPKTLEERFWSKVDKNGPDGCWQWTASKRSGYGQFGVWPKTPPAHRVSWELLVGPIPDGLVLDHLCRNRGCVNPSHLRAVTPRENILAPGALGVSKQQADKTHCDSGHEFTAENTSYLDPDRRWRRCKTCNRDRQRALREARRTSVCPEGHPKTPRRNGGLFCPICHGERVRLDRQRKRASRMDGAA